MLRKTLSSLVLCALAAFAADARAASADLKVTSPSFSISWMRTGEPNVATVHVQNVGPDAAQNVSLTIESTAGTTLTMGSDKGLFDNCQAAGATVHCTAAILPKSDFAFVVGVYPGSLLDGQTLSLTCAITSDTPDPVPSNNSATGSAEVIGPADLSVSGSFVPYNAGEITNVTLTMTNNGPNVARQASFDSNMRYYTYYPEEYIISVTQVSGPPASLYFDKVNKDTVRASVASLAPGESIAVKLVIQTWSLRQSIYLHTVVSEQNNNPSTSQLIDFRVKPDALADLVGFGTAPATVFVGNDIPFVLSVRSRGPSDAEHVTVTWSVPPNTSFVSLKVEPFAYSFTCTPLAAGSTSGTITCTDGYADWTGANVIDPSILTFTVHANSIGTVTNHATFTSTTPLTNTADDFTDKVTTVTTPEAAFDGSITITPSAARVRPSSPLSYTIKVSNAGPGTMTNATVALSLPAGFTGTCGAQCTIASLAAGASTTITISGNSPPSPANTTATATLSAAGDTNGANDAASANVLVQLPADLTLALSTNVPATPPGTAFLATATLHNNGPGPADATVLTLEGPQGSTPQPYNGNSDICKIASNKVRCEIGTLAADATRTIVFAVGQPNANATYTYTATATTTDESNPADNSASVNVIRTTDCDLEVTATAGPSSVKSGELVVYDITVRNVGIANAGQDAVVTDVIPPGSLLLSAENTSHSAAECRWNDTKTAVICEVFGRTNEIDHIRITTTAPLTPGSYTNSVSVSASTDVVSSNNNVTNTVTVAAGDAADLSVTLPVLSAVKAGTDFVVTTVLRNDGPSAATNVQLKPSLDNVTLRNLTGAGATCTLAGCTLPSLAAGATATFNVAVTAPSGSSPNFKIVMTASSSTTDQNPANNTAWQYGSVSPAVADLQLTASGPATAAPMQKVIYHVDVRNAGGDAADNVTLFLNVPAGFVFPPQTAVICNQTSGDLTSAVQICKAPHLDAGGRLSLDLAAIPTAAGTFNVRFGVSSDAQDSNANDNSALLTIAVVEGRRRTSRR